MRAPLAFDDLHTLRPASEWTEEDGFVLWWHLPICEPPYVGSHECMGERYRDGTPTACARLQRSGWLTHWSPLPDCRQLKSTDGVEVHR